MIRYSIGVTAIGRAFLNDQRISASVLLLQAETRNSGSLYRIFFFFWVAGDSENESEVISSL